MTSESGQLTKGEVRLFGSITGEAVSDSFESIPGGKHNQKSLKQPGLVTLRSWYAEVKVWSNRRNDKLVLFMRGAAKESRTSEGCLIISPTFQYLGVGRLRYIFSEYGWYLLGNWAGFYDRAYQQLLPPTWNPTGLVCRRKVSCGVDRRND